MKCIKCNQEIESDDNFCFNCGHWTAHGYAYFNDNKEHMTLLNGSARRAENKMLTLFSLIVILVCLFVVILFVRGIEILKPYVYVKKNINNYKYGYITSIIDTDREYHKININTLEDANNIIQSDLDSQKWQCVDNIDNYHIEEDLKNKYKIKSISFCDMSTEEVVKIKNVIDNFFALFPTTIGYLDIITITNADPKDRFVAYFQAVDQFVNRNDDISNYNKVNKSQILLNSYYFLNDSELSRDINESVDRDFYVADATWESLIAHELGHYLTYVALLKEYNVNTMTLVTKDNKSLVEDIIDSINGEVFARDIVNKAIENYNKKYNEHIEIGTYSKNISSYAGTVRQNGDIITSETIAEAVHDYYLHREKASKYSLEIMYVLQEKLGDSK